MPREMLRSRCLNRLVLVGPVNLDIRRPRPHRPVKTVCAHIRAELVMACLKRVTEARAVQGTLSRTEAGLNGFSFCDQRPRPIMPVRKSRLARAAVPCCILTWTSAISRLQ